MLNFNLDQRKYIWKKKKSRIWKFDSKKKLSLEIIKFENNLVQTYLWGLPLLFKFPTISKFLGSSNLRFLFVMSKFSGISIFRFFFACLSGCFREVILDFISIFDEFDGLNFDRLILQKNKKIWFSEFFRCNTAVCCWLTEGVK